MHDEEAPGPLTQASAPEAPARLDREDARSSGGATLQVMIRRLAPYGVAVGGAVAITAAIGAVTALASVWRPSSVSPTCCSTAGARRRRRSGRAVSRRPTA